GRHERITHDHRRLQLVEVAGAEGFEPSNTGSKVPRLTAWPRPKQSASRSVPTSVSPASPQVDRSSNPPVRQSASPPVPGRSIRCDTVPRRSDRHTDDLSTDGLW